MGIRCIVPAGVWNFRQLSRKSTKCKKTLSKIVFPVAFVAVGRCTLALSLDVFGSINQLDFQWMSALGLRSKRMVTSRNEI